MRENKKASQATIGPKRPITNLGGTSNTLGRAILVRGPQGAAITGLSVLTTAAVLAILRPAKTGRRLARRGQNSA
ncbi:hypothetical protein KPB2_5554 [Klebsiella pneumoniae Kb677]|nr:hypothetical protein KPB2_5554 [Klebsiella pneumoniae Kb677]